MSGLPPTPTTIFAVFSKVDLILAELSLLTAQSPSYSQFNTTLRQLTAQTSAIQDQLDTFQNQIEAILLVLQAIIEAMATLANQGQIIQLLQNIRTALEPTAPVRVGLDLENIETVSQPMPSRRGP